MVEHMEGPRAFLGNRNTFFFSFFFFPLRTPLGGGWSSHCVPLCLHRHCGVPRLPCLWFVLRCSGKKAFVAGNQKNDPPAIKATRKILHDLRCTRCGPSLCPRGGLCAALLSLPQ